jgi:signal transduction histidine kinase
MSEPVWYRSLYWRIALGFVALLAVLLLLQGFVFLWMTGRMTELFPNRSPAQLAASIAGDAASAIAERPDTDLDAYLNGRYSGSARGFVVVFRDGRVIASRRVEPPRELRLLARMRLFDDRPGERRGPPPFRQGSSGFPGDPPDGFRRGGRGDDFGRRGPPIPAEYAPVVVNGEAVGMVAVTREPPPLSVAIRSLGPTIGFVALALLVTGTAVGALLIFRPARRRLQGLQVAARAIGEGQVGVRAPETGGDEVTVLARTFNEMAEQLEQRTAALETADRTRRQLLADVSHELTTPLAAIRGYIETLEMPGLALDAATRSRYLTIVNEETERLEHIVGDLLDLARLEGGGGSLRVEVVPVSQLLARVRHRHQPAVAEKQIVLETMQDQDVSSVRGDANRLEQALQNLVANAVRHTPPNGRVRVSAHTIDGMVQIVVDDTGPGIPAEHLPRVFDRFYKVDESRTGTAIPSGSGLGLSIVQAIVARHGGSVRASNLDGGGASFEMRLPRADASEALGGAA